MNLTGAVGFVDRNAACFERAIQVAQRQAHDVRVAARDARDRAEAVVLDRVRRGFVEWVARFDIARDFFIRIIAQRDGGRRHLGQRADPIGER